LSLLSLLSLPPPPPPCPYPLPLHAALPFYPGRTEPNQGPRFVDGKDERTQLAAGNSRLKITDHGFNREVDRDPKGPCRVGHTRRRKSTRLNSSHVSISYAVFCLKKKNTKII